MLSSSTWICMTFNRRRLKFTRVLVVWVYILSDAYENSDCFILCYHMILNFTHSSRVVRICISLLTIFSCLLGIWTVSVSCLGCLGWSVGWWNYFVVQTGFKFLGSIFQSSAHLWNSWTNTWLQVFIKFFIIYVSPLLTYMHSIYMYVYIYVWVLLGFYSYK